jgi:uncharacterized damage-inducible protein DinB
MATVKALAKEFDREIKTTRKHLERMPGDKLDWRPHKKSFTLRELGSHLVECAGWTDVIFSGAEFDIDPRTYKSYLATSVEDLLRTFDETAVRGHGVLASASDDTLVGMWRFKIMGKVRFERSRADVFRDFTLSHLIHHRGQLSVYLRLLDVPVPGAYGPSADEQP